MLGQNISLTSLVRGNFINSNSFTEALAGVSQLLGMRPEGAEGDRSKPAITLVKCVSGENLYASFHARRMPADDTERSSSCVRIFVKLQGHLS